MLTFIDPKKGGVSGRYKAGTVNYGGRKYRTALVGIGGIQVELGLADTGRCAVDLEAAENTVRTLVEQHGVNGTDGEIVAAASALQMHCRQITGWKPRQPRR